MMHDFLKNDGPFFTLLDKLGQLIVLSALWLLGCLPLVTFGNSTAALYYAVIKAVRRGQGSAVREFWSCYRASLRNGITLTLITVPVGILLAVNLNILQGGGNPLLSGGALIGLMILCFTWVYVGPVLSRFRIGPARIWKLAFVMSIRFLHITLLLLFCTAILAALQIYVLPVPAVLILPGVWCYLITFPMEKTLLAFMPEKDETDNAWYYET